MTMRMRFVASGLVMASMILIVAGTALLVSRSAADSARRIGLGETSALTSASAAFNAASIDLRDYASTGDAAARDRIGPELAALASGQAALENAARSAPAGESSLIARLSRSIARFRVAALSTMESRRARGSVPAADLAVFSAAVSTAQADMDESLRAAATGMATTMADQLGSTGWGLVGLACFSLVISAAIAGTWLESILRPLTLLQNASAALAEGDTDLPVDAERKDEIGDLARSFVAMRSRLSDAMAELNEEIGRRGDAQRRFEASAAELARSNEQLEAQARDRKSVDDQLGSANAKLNTRLREVASVTDEMATLAEMGSMLQSDLEISEAFDIVSSYALALLPQSSGALYLMAPSRNMLDFATSWGEAPPTAKFFAPNDCWSLRLGRPHAPDEEHVVTNCAHVAEDDSGAYLCVPLTAHGDGIGVMVFYNISNACVIGDDEAARARPRRLAATLSEQVALALSNIKLRATLREQSIKDPLTGLYNRRYMDEAIDREVSQALRSGSALSFAMLDVDHFKDYNDRTGHGAGDAALAAVGRFLRESIRSGDISCRYGGEEFLIALVGAGEEDARARAEDIREGIKRLSFEIGESPLSGITVSIGVASLGTGRADSASILAAADDALYMAKDRGRDRVCSAAAIESLPDPDDASPDEVNEGPDAVDTATLRPLDKADRAVIVAP